MPPEKSGVETVEWLLDQIRAGSIPVDPTDSARYVASTLRERFEEVIEWARGRYHHDQSLGTEKVAPTLFHANFLDTKGRRAYLRIALTEESEVRGLSFLRPLPTGIEIRPATEADWPRVAALEPRCPTVNRKGLSTAIDRGRRGADHFRLQREVALSVAELNGELIGARALPVRECVLDGVVKRLMFSHFVRVLPKYQSIGLYPHLHVTAREQVAAADRIFAYMDPENDAMRAALGGQRGWHHRVLRVFIDCAEHADVGSVIDPGGNDLGHICRLINAANDRRYFFSPYSADSLAERLSRAPQAYALKDFLLSGNATLGVYWEGQRRTTTWHDGEVRNTVHATIMDVGFEGDPESGELDALIRNACRQGLARGISHLTAFTSHTAPEAGLLKRLAEETQEFEFFGPEDEPANIASRGLYVDPIYF